MSGRLKPTGAPMATFEVWDIVKVPFPYTDRPVRQCRPALVVAADEIEVAHGLLWLVMITSAENRGWVDDVGISDLRAAGLPAPSIGWMHEMRNGSAPYRMPIAKPLQPVCAPSSAPCSRHPRENSTVVRAALRPHLRRSISTTPRPCPG